MLPPPRPTRRARTEGSPAHVTRTTDNRRTPGVLPRQGAVREASPTTPRGGRLDPRPCRTPQASKQEAMRGTGGRTSWVSTGEPANVSRQRASLRTIDPPKRTDRAKTLLVCWEDPGTERSSTEPVALAPATIAQAPWPPPAAVGRLTPTRRHEARASRVRRPAHRGAPAKAETSPSSREAPGGPVTPCQRLCSLAAAATQALQPLTATGRRLAPTPRHERELAPPETDEPKSADHGRDVTVSPRKPARRMSDVVYYRYRYQHDTSLSPDPLARHTSRTTSRRSRHATEVTYRPPPGVDRLPDPVVSRCDQVLGARTPRGPRHARKPCIRRGGAPTGYHRPRLPRRGARRHLRARPYGPTLRRPRSPLDERRPHPNLTSRPCSCATRSVAGSGPEGPSPRREHPRGIASHRSSVHPNRSRPRCCHRGHPLTEAVR
jgi:hypothetical protein